RQVVTALCRLAGPAIPVVFCFDQIEALQVDAQDTKGLFAFGQMVTELFQGTKNALLISSVQASFLDLLKGAVREAHWERMAFIRTPRETPRGDEARKLVRARLSAEPALESFRPPRAGPLWPLPEERLKPIVEPVGCTARRLLAACAELFDEVRG